MTPVLVFDIETIPDVAGLRVLHELPAELSDAEVAEFAFQRQRAKNGSDFLPHHLQRVVVISCALRSDEGFRVWSLAEPKSTEGEIIQRFFDGIEKFTPQIVSWNGGGFDLPVLHYRGMIHHVAAPRYWDMGEGDYRDSRDFKWNNYISRYHMRHTDLMDLLAMYQPRGSAPLDQLARLMGLPGKLGMDGSAVWGAWLEGRIDEIRDYCETDVVNTFLVFLRFQLMRGLLTADEHARELELVKSSLAATGAAHWTEFLAAWDAQRVLIDADNSALLVIDVQERLLPAIDGGQACVDNVIWLLRVARRIGVPVLACEQYPQGLGPTHPAVAAELPADCMAEKIYFSAVAAGCHGLGHDGPDQYVVCGTEAHVCVMQTVLELVAAGKRVFVVEEAVGSRRASDKALALARMREAGATVVSREMVAFEWLRRAATPLFREISRDFLR